MNVQYGMINVGCLISVPCYYAQIADWISVKVIIYVCLWTWLLLVDLQFKAKKLLHALRVACSHHYDIFTALQTGVHHIMN